MANNSTPKPDNFRPDIEGLRGLAVLAVVIFHVGLLSNNQALSGGFIGVDLFFVISGFLITGLLLREQAAHGTINFPRFYARRVRRILPAALIVILVTLPLCAWLLPLLSRPEFMRDGTAAALSIANIRFALTTDYFNQVTYSPFLHFWSLGVEEQFYLVWPALIALLAWATQRLWRRASIGIFGLLVFVILASLTANILMTAGNPAWAFYLLPTRAWQLALGGLLVFLVEKENITNLLSRRALQIILSLVGWVSLIILVFEALALNSAQTPYPGLAAILPTLAALGIIATGSLTYGPGLLFRRTPLRFLGKISYSLYLWHWPILILGGLFLAGPLAQFIGLDQALGLAAFSVIVATTSWALIEEPARRGHLPFKLPVLLTAHGPSLPSSGRLVGVGVSFMLIVALCGLGFDWQSEQALASLGGDDPIAAASPIPSSLATPTLIGTTPTPASTPFATDVPTPTDTPTPAPTLPFAVQLTPSPAPETTSSTINAATRPTIAHAATDYEQDWRDGCFGRESTGTIPAAGVCVYGNKNSSYSVVLLGDSHASALEPAIAGVATAQGWKLTVYVKADCPFTNMRIYSDYLKREYTECESWDAQVLKRLKADPPNLAVISMNHGMSPQLSADSGPGAQGHQIGLEIAKLPSQTTVVLIDDPAYPLNHSVPPCLSVYPNNYHRCNFAFSLMGSTYGQRERIAAAATGATVIDLNPILCPTLQTCPVVANNMIMWRDEHHLTATFSASLAPFIEAQLVDILNKPYASPSPPPSLPY
jgi:peptidoglycan/LPS O-acetylase OafA/YrhL